VERPTRPLSSSPSRPRDGRPIYTHRRVLPGFTKEAIRDYAKASIEPGSRVLSDGLSCFNGLAEADLRHIVKITGSGRPEGSDFKWVNTGLGNVKSAIMGTLRSCDPQHAPRYLAAFEWRYNRGFELKENLCSLTRAAATIAPLPRRKIIAIRPNPAD
jgi:transposase-like protein